MARKRGTGLLVVMTTTMGVGPLVLYGLSTVSPLLMDELGISEAQFGFVATASFFSSALTAMWLGRVSDRISGKSQLLIIFGGCAVSLFALTLAPNYGWLLAAVIISGPAQALSTPMTNRLIVSQVPSHKRAGWIGVKQSGVQGSQLFAGLFFPAAALLIGWRGAASASAVLILLLMILSWNKLPLEAPFTASPARERTPTVARERGTSAGRVGGLPFAGGRRLPAGVWILAAYALVSGAGIQATNLYLPLFGVREFGLNLLFAGLIAAVSGVVGVSSRILWGRKLDTGTGLPSLLLVLALGALLGAVLLWAAGESGLVPLLWVGVAIHGATALAASVLTNAGVMREVPSSRVGEASGFVAFGMYFGFALGPLTMGAILQFSGAFSYGWIAVGATYVACALLALLLRAATARRGDGSA